MYKDDINVFVKMKKNQKQTIRNRNKIATEIRAILLMKID